ncbi:MAG TPA: DUF4192 domain-containing protein [Nocardioidaceae bacterium]|nr:DUF4192 domain-containing protein [Nocardioidaceae bacterium]
MPKTFTIRSAADMLAAVPYLLGFHPEDSVVMVSVGPAGEQCHARMDLPDASEQLEEVVATLGSVARRNRLRRCALVLYTDDACLADDVVEAIAASLESAGVEVVEAVRADGDRWYPLTGCTGPCCPQEGTPYDVSSHPITAQAVLDGQVTWGSRRELAESLVGTDLDALEAVGEAADRAMARFQAALRHPLGPPSPENARAHLVREGTWVRSRVRRFLRDGAPLDSDDAGRLLVALVAIDVRDVAWAEVLHENAAKHVRLWRDLVRRCPLDLLAAPAALLGFAAWLTGDGALAWCAVERSQESEPDYRMAALLAQALAGGMSPSSWRPLDPAELGLFAS